MNTLHTPDRTRGLARLPMATMFPMVYVQRLVSAASRSDVASIDKITAEMAAAGLVRHPKDGSRFGSVAVDAAASSAG